MRRRAPIGAVLAAVLLLAAPASGDPGADKARIDASIGDLQSRIDSAGRQADVLTSELSAVTARTRDLQQGVETEEVRLQALQSELAASRARLSRLDVRLEEQARRLAVLRGEYAVALKRLERRVREIYETDSPDALSFALGASSFSDVLDSIDVLRRIGRQDERIAAAVQRTTQQLARMRAETKRARIEVARETRAVARRTEEQRGVRDRLAANRDALLAAERDKRRMLASITDDRAGFVAEVEALQAQSAALAARIAAAQAAAAARAAAERAAAAQSSGEATAPAPTPSVGGFAWPVAGPVTSGFGERWGRMHEGIDIAVSSGTPVRAAAAGTVIEAGWIGGYGNLVVIDHGNGVATAYAHNSSFAASVGGQVAQGEVIAYSGNTGHSTGPHVHFEVRVGGAAVDPLGYL